MTPVTSHPGRGAHEAEARQSRATREAIQDACGVQRIDFAGARDRELAARTRTEPSALWLLRERHRNEGKSE